MARFYQSSTNERSTKRNIGGRKLILTHIRGWNKGLRIQASINKDGLDEFQIYETHGSMSGDSLDGDRLVKIIVDKKSAGPRNVKGQLK